MILGPKPMDAFIDDMLTSECSEQARKYHSMLLDGGFLVFLIFYFLYIFPWYEDPPNLDHASWMCGLCL